MNDDAVKQVKLHNELLYRFSRKLTSAVKPHLLEDDVSSYFDEGVEFFYDSVVDLLSSSVAFIDVKTASVPSSTQ